jgi:uncharacterized protein
MNRRLAALSAAGALVIAAALAVGVALASREAPQRSADAPVDLMPVERGDGTAPASPVLVAQSSPQPTVDPASPGSAGITVTGIGSVSVAPDRSEWSFGVQTEAADAGEAMEANARRVRTLIGALRAAGVAAADIQTAHVSLWPHTDERGSVTRYVAANTVRVLVRDLARSGAVIEAAVDAGGNQVSGPALSRADHDAQYRRALAAALAAARADAEALARAAGVQLGPVTAIVESGASSVGPGRSALAVAEDASIPVEPGRSEITAAVTVTFALGNARDEAP